MTKDEIVKKEINWFPGHMARAIREIKEKLSAVDIVFEIRDARVPLGSGNKMLEETLRQKSHLIILNKVNLVPPNAILHWEKWFEEKGTPFIFIDCFDKNSLKKVLSKARSIVDKKRRESNPDQVSKAKMRLLIIGLPNTGKSTIINQLAGRVATKVADRPGQTQVQQLIVIDKDLELIDTPGVMPPNLDSQEHGLWLSAINAIPDDIVGEELPAVFLIKYFMNQNPSKFFDRYKLDSKESMGLSIEEIIEKIAVVRGCLKQKGQLDLERVYKLILSDFRKGEYGKCCFEVAPKI